MRYSPKQLENKRGRKKRRVSKPRGLAPMNLAIFCSADDFLMTPGLEKQERSSKVTVIYVCPNCGNKVNPLVENSQHAMTVQTADNAIAYPGKRKTVVGIKKRTYSQDKKDPLDKFINEPIPGITDSMYTKITARTIQRPRTRSSGRIKVYD